MKTYTFPYGTGEWGGTIDVELTDEESALLEASMAKDKFFHMDEDPDLEELEHRIYCLAFEENKKAMEQTGELQELQEEYPDEDIDDLVSDSLGNFHICMPDAFDWIKRK